MVYDAVNRANAVEKKGRMIRGGPERQIANQAITEMISFVKKYRREAVFYFG